MIIIRLVSFLAIVVLLVGCSFTGENAIIHDYNKDYRYARSIPPLKMPHGIHSQGINDNYAVPANRPKYTGQPSLIPPGNPGAAVRPREQKTEKKSEVNQSV